LNGLKGIRVENVELSIANFTDGSNMHGNVIIPNPSVMTLEIGDMVQDLFADGKNIGFTTMKNVVLRPGDNKIPVTSSTNQAAVLPLIGPGHKFPDGVLEIEARSRNVVNSKNETLDYFTAAMKANPVHFKLDIADALRAIKLGAVIDGATPKGGSTTSAAAPAASSLST